jgi:hypothetical protein
VEKIADNPTLSESERVVLREKVANASLYGIDVGKDPNQAQLARMNMYLHGDGGSSIYEADFLERSFWVLLRTSRPRHTPTSYGKSLKPPQTAFLTSF